MSGEKRLKQQREFTEPQLDVFETTRSIPPQRVHRPRSPQSADNVVSLRHADFSRLATVYARVWKVLLDQGLASIMLLLLSPLLLFVAAGVKLSSPGPVFFKQKRHGLNNKEFDILKFRTMVVHEEEEGAVTPACRTDARVTSFGAFLRRTSMDELPQLLNVIAGHMSLVGPRPHAVPHNLYFKDRIPAYMDRHLVKPGLTGWAQVCGYRGAIESDDSMRARLEHDRWYIHNWSPLLDLKVIVLTITNLGHPNAY